jgi:multiple antibiotic resistance protein
MFEMFQPYLLTFIQLFVAVDAIGNIPVFVSLVENTGKREKQRIVIESVTTATVLAILFMFVGKWVLRSIGITIPDFQIAGGLLLFVISLRLLMPGSQKGFLSDGHSKDVAVFPLGTPLITGPAVLTTTLMMLDAFGLGPTFVALVLNMVIVWLTLVRADIIVKLIGLSGTRAFSKIMYILLAAIGVMMVRRGLEGVLLP